MGMLRRTFLVGLGLVGGGLLIGGYAASREWDNPLLIDGVLPDGDVPLTPFVSVAADSTVTVYVPRAEMGQGVTTTLAALVAEEMGLGLDDIVVAHGPASGAYYNATMLQEGGPFAFTNERFVARNVRRAAGAFAHVIGLQVTGGSTSTRDAFVKMRMAGAAARAALRDAAAKHLSVSADDVGQEGRSFVSIASGARTSFGDIATAAAEQALPTDVPLTDTSEWRILGRSQPRTDTLAKVTGQPLFGIDVELPGMLHATVVAPPVMATGLASADTEAARAVPGVIDVVDLATRSGAGFGIIAHDTWSAFRGAEELDAVWSGDASTEMIEASIEAALQGSGSALVNRGNVDAAATGVAPERYVEASYAAPFLAHATMEPMNATAQFNDDKLAVWVGTQAPTIVKDKCAEVLGIDPADVSVMTTLLGGGFGRRAEIDFAVYAAALAKETNGAPVKVTWRREEDTTHDAYRPAARARYRAVLSDPGDSRRTLNALDATIASPSVIDSMAARTYPDLPTGGPDRLLTEGAFDQPYEIANVRVVGVRAPQSIPVGFWRSVGYSYNCFFHESFVDECAHASGRDPLDFRLDLATPYDVARNALQTVADMSGWGRNEPGRAKGVAFCLSFGAWVAQVIEVERRDGDMAVTRGWCAVDVGLALDPDIIAAQMRGGMIFGLSAAIGQAITVADGRVVQANFDAFDALRIGQTPPIEVAVLEASPRMGGAGEPGVPPAAPALANAIFALDGTRLRAMPFAREVSFVGW